MTFTTPQQVIDRARRLGYISSAQYNDTKALEDFNVVYKGLETEPAVTDFRSIVFTSTPGVSPVSYDLINVSSLKKGRNNVLS